MKKQVQLMKEFNKAFGDFEQDSPNIDIPQKYKDLRIKLMQSELDEVKQAIENKDLENLAAEIGDLLYTVIGTATTFGLGEKLEAIFAEIHKSNMSKIWPDGKPHLTPEGKAIKPENFQKVDMQKVLEQENSNEENEGNLEDIQETIMNYAKARKWFPLEPEDLAKSIVLEAAELLEFYQWDNTTRNIFKNEVKEKNFEEMEMEVADIAIYLIEFTQNTNINLIEAIKKKLAKLEIKYPAEKFKDGHNDEYYLEQKKKYRKNV